MYPVSGPVDPGATPLRDRAPAPDLARGEMLLLIALANVTAWTYGRPHGLRGYPRDGGTVDRVVTGLQLVLVDGRAYPLFGLLFGYGVLQLARRRAAVGMPAPAAVALVRRRGWWLLLIGALHGVLLFSGDIAGAYGLLAVLLAGLLVRGTDSALLATAAAGAVLSALFGGAAVALTPPDLEASFPSVTTADPGAALAERAVEYLGGGLIGSALSVFGAVALGSWAARRGLLDDPARHRRLLARTAAAGVGAAVLGGLPLALMATGGWPSPGPVATLVAGALHTLTGYLGGIGYAALFGLLALRLTGQGRGQGPGPATRAVQACGQRSLSAYLAQSVLFAALLPAWTLGLGARLTPATAALLAVAVWLVGLLGCALAARFGRRGPAEVLLRRLTYGPARTG